MKLKNRASPKVEPTACPRRSLGVSEQTALHIGAGTKNREPHKSGVRGMPGAQPLVRVVGVEPTRLPTGT